MKSQHCCKGETVNQADLKCFLNVSLIKKFEAHRKQHRTVQEVPRKKKVKIQGYLTNEITCVMMKVMITESSSENECRKLDDLK